MKNQIMFHTGILFAVFFVSCIRVPVAEFRRHPETVVPETYSLYSAEPKTPDRWWQAFQDPELDALVNTALAGNFSIQRAWSRLRQARASAIQAGAGRFPDLTADVDAAVKRQRSENGNAAGVTSGDSYGVGFVSRYEIDLWGRVRSERQAARLEAEASREDVNAAAVTLAAEVVGRWAGIIAARMQKQLLERQLETNRVYLELVKLRFGKGMVSALDVYQQQQTVERVAAQIPVAEKNERLLRNELSLLLGKPPGAGIVIHRSRIPIPLDVPEAGLPMALLANRPDIRSAGLRIRASQQQLAAARANRLPAIRLTATSAAGPADLDLVFDNWLLQLAANVTAPILDGGQRAAEVVRVESVVDEKLIAYREAVYTAVKEVEDALVTEEKQRQRIALLEKQKQTAKRALEEARERYRKGLNTYLPVLTQLLTVQNLENDLIRQKTDLVLNRVALHRALGGTWPRELAPSGNAAGTRSPRPYTEHGNS